MSAAALDTQSSVEEEFVVNRSGEKEPVRFDKIRDRLSQLGRMPYGPRLAHINLTRLTQYVVGQFQNGMTTSEIDRLAVAACLSLAAEEPGYTSLAARLVISDLQKTLPPTMLGCYERLVAIGRNRIRPAFLELLRRYGDSIEAKIDYHRDFLNVGFSAETLVRSYLLRSTDASRSNCPSFAETPVVVPDYDRLRENDELNDSPGDTLTIPSASEKAKDTNASAYPAELPQHMYMRMALTFWCLTGAEDPDSTDPDEIARGLCAEEDMPRLLEQAFHAYEMLSTKRISHASPTVFNSGMRRMQMASCFLAQVDDDFGCLYDVVRDTALMSKHGGGIGIDLTRMRAEGAYISSSGGKSAGIGRYSRLTNANQINANQGDHRPGAFAMYLSTYHADIITFLELARRDGPRAAARDNAPDMKYAMWTSDLFWRTVEEELAAGDEAATTTAGDWYLFSPDTAPGLDTLFDRERLPKGCSASRPVREGGWSWSQPVQESRFAFSQQYWKYAQEGRAFRKIKVSKILQEWARTVAQRGFPYVLSKDSINRRSNLSHYQTITNSNLCAEITIPCRTREHEPGQEEYSVCVLGAVNLSAHVQQDLSAPAGCSVDFEGIIQAAGVLVSNLNHVIDLNFSPVPGAHRSNHKHRALGIGVLGLADVFARLRLPFGSVEARRLDAAMHAAIYFGAMTESTNLAQIHGSHETFEGSPASFGILQPDLSVRDGTLAPDWEADIERDTQGAITPAMWAKLREACKKGVRNGYATSTMPTATSANAAGANESVEPFTTNLYPRKTAAGEYTLLNQHLVAELRREKQWNTETSRLLLRSNGSVQQFDGKEGRPYLSEAARKLFRTARELDQRILTVHAAVRAPFISQSQSLNKYWTRIELPAVLDDLLLGWRLGNTTLCYYSHSQPAGGTMQKRRDKPAPAPACTRDNPDCAACSV